MNQFDAKYVRVSYILILELNTSHKPHIPGAVARSAAMSLGMQVPRLIPLSGKFFLADLVIR